MFATDDDASSRKKSLAAQTSSPLGGGDGHRLNCARGRVFNINHLTNYSNKLTDGGRVSAGLQS